MSICAMCQYCNTPAHDGPCWGWSSNRPRNPLNIQRDKEIAEAPCRGCGAVDPMVHFVEGFCTECFAFAVSENGAYDRKQRVLSFLGDEGVTFEELTLWIGKEPDQ